MRARRVSLLHRFILGLDEVSRCFSQRVMPASLFRVGKKRSFWLQTCSVPNGTLMIAGINRSDLSKSYGGFIAVTLRRTNTRPRIILIQNSYRDLESKNSFWLLFFLTTRLVSNYCPFGHLRTRSISSRMLLTQTASSSLQRHQL